MAERICPNCETVTEQQTCPSCGSMTVRANLLRDGRDPLVGRLVGDRFRVIELLGRGGMGSVYLAEQLSMKRMVALKVINALENPDHAARRQAFKRFEREAHAASRLEHHNTVRVFDFGISDDGTMFLAMELLRGRTLASVMCAGPMPPARVVNIAIQVCRSLAEAHQKGIIHRDLKPDNVMVIDTADEKDFVKVLDFGIAKVAAGADESSVTSAGMIVGTPAYMAPEQATASRVVPATDLYALGVIMYEALTGRPPFNAPTPLAVLMKHVSELPPPIVANGFPPGIPDELAALVMRLLEKSHHLRPKSALDLAVLLAKVPLENSGVAAVPPIDAFAAPSMTPSMADSIERAMNSTVQETPRRVGTGRRRLVLLAVSALLVVIIAGVTVVAIGWRPGDRPESIMPPAGVATAVDAGDVLTAVDTARWAPATGMVDAGMVNSDVTNTVVADARATDDTVVVLPTPAPPVSPAASVPDVPARRTVRSKPVAADSQVPESTGGTTATDVDAANPVPPACIRASCPISGDCVDELGHKLSGASFCDDLAL